MNFNNMNPINQINNNSNQNINCQNMKCNQFGNNNRNINMQNQNNQFNNNANCMNNNQNVNCQNMQYNQFVNNNRNINMQNQNNQFNNNANCMNNNQNLHNGHNVNNQVNGNRLNCNGEAQQGTSNDDPGLCIFFEFVKYQKQIFLDVKKHDSLKNILRKLTAKYLWLRHLNVNLKFKDKLLKTSDLSSTVDELGFFNNCLIEGLCDDTIGYDAVGAFRYKRENEAKNSIVLKFADGEGRRKASVIDITVSRADTLSQVLEKLGDSYKSLRGKSFSLKFNDELLDPYDDVPIYWFEFVDGSEIIMTERNDNKNESKQKNESSNIQPELINANTKTVNGQEINQQNEIEPDDNKKQSEQNNENSSIQPKFINENTEPENEQTVNKQNESASNDNKKEPEQNDENRLLDNDKNSNIQQSESDANSNNDKSEQNDDNQPDEGSDIHTNKIKYIYEGIEKSGHFCHNMCVLRASKPKIYEQITKLKCFSAWDRFIVILYRIFVFSFPCVTKQFENYNYDSNVSPLNKNITNDSNVNVYKKHEGNKNQEVPLLEGNQSLNSQDRSNSHNQY